MFLTKAVDPISIPDALVLSAVGFGIVFAVLIVLMVVIQIITSLVAAFEKKPEPAVADGPAPAAAPAAPKADPNAGKVPAPGSLGECDLHSVDDKTAAMLMAIVADEMQTPLNELRFISIQEVQEEKKS